MVKPFAKAKRSSTDRALSAIADVYAAEGRVPATRTAQALRRGLGQSLGSASHPCAFDDDIRHCLASSDRPAAKALLAAQGNIPWGVNPVADHMTPDAAGMVAVCTLLDPDGPIHSPLFRLGLLYMRPGSYYPLHNHDADETYVLVAGSALWTAGGDTRWRSAGDSVHHPSLMPHAFRTADQGFVALWRWSGDINSHSYSFLPDPAADQIPQDLIADLPFLPGSPIPRPMPGA
ncbi:dimethylsulfonioproprionate lyase family protein [Pseudotabrizicola sp. L79]|uniref:dimethylsulfonioproprionate lyase family protein n=1 Tax=Pseudotabrizicola sp. L79 TaxID=3118402 RepID=UPI002F92D5B0